VASIDRIDKEAFLAAATCLTQGWYVRHAPKEEPSPGVEWRFYVGAEIGRLARGWLGAGVPLPRSPVENALAATAKALDEAGTVLAYEPTFATGDFVARADAVRKNGTSWDLIEVKSGKLPESGDPKKVKSDYIDDFAFTTFVAKAAGLEVARCVMVLIRGDYRYGQPMSELLGEIDVTNQVLPKAREFDAMSTKVATALQSDDRPDPVLILACKDCPFYATQCLGVGVADPLFFLPRLSAKRFEEMKAYGRISALPGDVDLTDPQKRVATVFRTGEPLVEPAGLKVLDDVVWPAYYLDFESVGPAIPWFPGVAPYEQMPFQLSLHVCDTPDHESAYHRYIAPIEGDWREELATRLVDYLGDHGSILMYSPYERRMLNYLAEAVPRLAADLTRLVDRLYDLEPVFKNGYYEKGFKGRTSIKETLPTMVPDLSYRELAVRGGDDAAGLFALMRVGKYSPADCKRHEEGLLEYCKMDTLAMVRLHQALAEIHRTRS
jgi:hypothetical protein